ncbi:MAG: pyruvate kinase [Desulfohalobiaceae bacterium]|nr:pyruvate kinase [Desulfohalobiaceae bacterium]
MHIKTVATLGPSCSGPEIMRGMVESGVRIFRLNFSHARPHEFQESITLIRAIEQDLEIPLTIMGDLSGPKIRIDELTKSPLEIDKGQDLFLGLQETRDRVQEGTFVGLSFPSLLQGLSPETEVVFSDGLLRCVVREVLIQDRLFRLEALTQGILSSNKGILFPGKAISLETVTPKDRKDLEQGLQMDIDCFALSFVRSKDDLLTLKSAMRQAGREVPVIAKLERGEAVQAIDSILEEADAVMVARGDLGLDCPMEQLPVTQKKLIRACRHAQKPAIVATQMLLSMVKSPMPTRAEATDVANAIYDGADCVMLSEETAVGSYPLEAVRFIQKIARETEPYYLERIAGPYPPKKGKNPGKYLAYSACLLADNTESKGLVCHSTTGLTARYISSRRPVQPIYALSPNKDVGKLLNFNWGVKPVFFDPPILNHMDRVEHFVQNSSLFEPGDCLTLTSGQPTPGQQKAQTNQIKIYYK